MQLWTHQPREFQIDAPDAVIDPTRGRYWSHDAPGFRYRDVLPKLQEQVETSQFLWCFTIPSAFSRPLIQPGYVEWELNVPESQILRFISGSVWEDIVWSESDDWDRLFVAGKPEASEDINALVLIPLPGGTARSHGYQPQYSEERLKDVAEALSRIAARAGSCPVGPAHGEGPGVSFDESDPGFVP